MKVYVSGPMSGYVDFNRPAFHAAASRLRAKGYDVVNPAELDETHPLPEDASHAEFLRRDVRLLVDCDLIYLLPGWKHSKGAAGEKAVADLCGIDVLVDSDVELWRTFEGEPTREPYRFEDIRPALPVHRIECESVEGDGRGNEWCNHGAQIRFNREGLMSC